MQPPWPDNLQCVVNLSFDVDGLSPWLYRSPDIVKFPSRVSQAEFGPTVGVYRILDMLDRYGIKASFYVPGHTAERHPALVEEIHRRGHEVGHHGYVHEAPAELTVEQEAQMLDRSIAILEGITGVRPRGYRAPFWDLSEATLELLAERGFLYDSSLMDNDVPYVLQTTQGSLVEVPVHWELDDAVFFSYVPGPRQRSVLFSPDAVYQVWSAAFDGLYHYGRSFVLVCHPQFIGRAGRMRMLERLVQHILSHPRVAFMTAADMARWALERAGRG